MKTASVLVEQAGQSDKLLIDQVTDVDSIFDEVRERVSVNITITVVSFLIELYYLSLT